MRNAGWLLLLLVAAAASARIIPAPSAPTLTVDGVSLGDPRAEVNSLLGPVLSQERAPGGILTNYKLASIMYDPAGRVFYVGGSTLECDGSVSGRVGEQHQAIRARLGPPDHAAGSRGSFIECYGPLAVWYQREDSQHPWCVKGFELSSGR